MPRAPAERAEPLDKAAWTAAALDALATGGIDAVRVEPLAKALGVTKGSFYWHFADRRALIDAVLTQWSEGRVAAIRQQATGGGAAAEVLRTLARLYVQRSNPKGLAIELAIRALARTDARAAQAVAAVDAERLAHVTKLFAALGWPAADAEARAVLFYGYLFGQSLLDRTAAPPAGRDLAVEMLLRPPA